jgi:hypothetical protein
MHLLGLLLALVAAPAQTQTGPWKTLLTEHYRIHYPAPAEDWASHVASQIEDVRARVVEEVGYDPPAQIDVFVEDPNGVANGAVVPLRQPYVLLYPSVPQPGSVIGHDRDWAELLLTHELTHQVHLARPSRNTGLRLLFHGLLGVRTIALRSPRWLVEGYATMVEGEITGFGRPHAEARSAVLRERARTGDLPSYRALSGEPALAYLMGSAYLEWLEARRPDGVRDLVAAMTAKQGSTFKVAFRTVFGESASELYGVFCAELTAAAKLIEHERGAEDGTLWHRSPKPLSRPDVSPDGSKVVLVAGGRTGDVVVWKTADPEDPWARWQASVDAVREADPDAPDPMRPAVPPPDTLRRRHRSDRRPGTPRWLDEDRVIFDVSFPLPNGMRRPELVVWDTQTGRERRLTRGAWVHDPVALPGGASVLAVEDRWGVARIVEVDTTTGETTPVTEGDVRHPVAQPDVHPDGTLAVWLRNDDGWKIVVHDLQTGAERVLDTPTGATVEQPTFGPDGTVYASVGVDGFREVWAFDDAPGPVTHTLGGARGAEVSPDGETLYFLVDHASGRDLHRKPVGERPEPGALSHPLVAPPAIRPEPVEAARPSTDFVTARRYRGGMPRPWVLLNGQTGPGGELLEVGGLLTDVPGRWTAAIAGGVVADGGPQAIGAQFRSRARRADVRARLWFGSEAIAPGSWLLGASLSTKWRQRWEGGVFRLEAGAWGDVPLLEPVRPFRVNAWTRLGLTQQRRFGGVVVGFHLAGAADAGAADVGVSNTRPWGHAEGTVDVYVRSGFLRLDLFGDYGRAWTENALEAWKVGGVRSVVVPETWQPGVVYDLAVPNVAMSGTERDRLGAQLTMFDAVEVWIRRHRVRGDCNGCESGEATVVGLELDLFSLASRVEVRGLDQLGITVGGGCLAELPGRGFQGACRRSEDFQGWLRFAIAP